MEELVGVVAAAGALLVAAGIPKITRPHETARALRSVGVTAARDAHVRALAVAEVALGVIVIVTSSRAAVAATALLYAGFTAFLVVALLRGGVVSSCGCAGRPDTPPTWGHVVMTSTFTVACAVGAVGGSTGLLQLDWSGSTGAAAGTAAAAAVVAWLGWAVLTVLPRLSAITTSARDAAQTA
jgi:hypothetical protein